MNLCHYVAVHADTAVVDADTGCVSSKQLKMQLYSGQCVMLKRRPRRSVVVSVAPVAVVIVVGGQPA